MSPYDLPPRRTKTSADPIVIRLDPEPRTEQREWMRPAARSQTYGTNLPHWVKPVADLLGARVSAREGEACGFFLFGRQYLHLQQWWKNIKMCESNGMWIEAHSQYGQIATAVLAEADLFSLGRIAALMESSSGNVHNMLDRTCQKVGARNRKELRAMVLQAIARRQDKCFTLITPVEKLRRDLYRLEQKPRSAGVYKAPYNGYGTSN
jgi:hypothetical protein